MVQCVITSDWNQQESNGLLISAPKSTHHHQLVFWDQCTSTSIWQSNGQVCFYWNHYFSRHRDTHTNDTVDWVYFSLEKKIQNVQQLMFPLELNWSSRRIFTDSVTTIAATTTVSIANLCTCYNKITYSLIKISYSLFTYLLRVTRHTFTQVIQQPYYL